MYGRAEGDVPLFLGSRVLKVMVRSHTCQDIGAPQTTASVLSLVNSPQTLVSSEISIPILHSPVVSARVEKQP